MSHRVKSQGSQHGTALWNSILTCVPLVSATDYSLQLSLLDGALGYLLIDQMFPHNLLYFFLLNFNEENLIEMYRKKNGCIHLD